MGRDKRGPSRGSWFAVRGSRFVVRGSWFVVRGAVAQERDPPAGAAALVAAVWRAAIWTAAGLQNDIQPPKPGKLLPGDGAKKRGTSPVNGSASAAEVGITTVEHVGL